MEETKTCEHCNQTFARADRSARTDGQWATQRFCSLACVRSHNRDVAHRAIPPRQCAICGGDYWNKYPSRHHCDSPACKEAYRAVAGHNISARMKADYAARKRKPASGISPREEALWPLLWDDGWVWRLRWIEREITYELDFAHTELMLDVEIDGAEHGWLPRRALDATRDAELQRRGWRILRIPNEDVDTDAGTVAQRIKEWAAAVG